MSVRSGRNTDNALRSGSRAVLAGFCLLLLAAAPPGGQGPDAPVRPGIDVWVENGYSPLAGRRVGLITNVTGLTADGRSSIDVLATSEAVRLVALFSPEHSLSANREGAVDGGTDTRTGLPVHSLHGQTRRPTDAMLEGLDGLVFDIQDIGTRFYTYATTLAYAMEEAARRGLPVVVLDRPNPIGGVAVSGPVLAEDQRSFVGYAPLPIRHGMTIGELALFFNGELGIGADLTVIPVDGWRRDAWFDQTGLLWVNPSPNMRSLTEAILYPAVGPLETTNVSVGRGTDTPFEWLGAPWIDARELARALNAAGLPGVRFVPRRLTPATSVHAGADCGGVNLLLTDRDAFDSGRTAAVLAVTLRDLYAADWDAANFPRLWGDPAIAAQLQQGASADAIVRSWQPGLQRFLEQRERYLLYR